MQVSTAALVAAFKGRPRARFLRISATRKEYSYIFGPPFKAENERKTKRPDITIYAGIWENMTKNDKIRSLYDYEKLRKAGLGR